MAKKKIEYVNYPTLVAQLYGTISRVYGILRLEAEQNTMDGRVEAVNNWCKEQDMNRIANKKHGC